MEIETEWRVVRHGTAWQSRAWQGRSGKGSEGQGRAGQSGVKGQSYTKKDEAGKGRNRNIGAW